jgi:hypothetical protein
METNCIVGLKDFCINSKISKATEEWNIEPLDEAKHTFRLTHSVTATGQRVFEPDGSIIQDSWKNAKDYVLNTIGLGIKAERMSAPGVLDATNLAAYNYLRAQHTNELGGFFGVTETWLCYDPQGEAPAIDDCTVTTRVSQEGRSSVSVEGNITGLQVSNNTTYAVTSSRYTNASSKWATVMSSLLTRAQTVSGVTLNPTVLNTQVGANEVNGTISYHHEYDDRPTATVPGAKWEKISVVDRNPADVFARIPVLGRPLGPVLQSIQTITEFRRNVTIEVQMPCKTMVFTPTKPSTAALVLGYTPIGIGSSVFIEQDDENWLDYDGRYSRNTTFCCNRGKAL